ncbi:MAG: hypothetical protein ABR548_03665 [Actinomycetota bacterium]|nr:hypothetical protein [Actinomycetota bacterium]
MAGQSLRLWANIVWLGLSAAAAAALLQGHNPKVYVGMGAVLCLAVLERDDPSWQGFVSSVAGRLGESLLYAAIAWSYARGDAPDTWGAAAAATLLSLSLISPYVRVRARSLDLAAPSSGSVERGVRVALVGIGFYSTHALLLSTVWTASGLTAAWALTRSAAVWRGARSA